MAYTKTTWVGDSDPYLNATNLNKIEQGIEDATDTADGAVQKSGDTMTGALIVPAPSAATHVPRLARTPTATGDLGLPGYAGSDTGWRDISADLMAPWQPLASGAGVARIRRVGAVVDLVLGIETSDASNQINVYQPQTEFLDYSMSYGTVGLTAYNVPAPTEVGFHADNTTFRLRVARRYVMGRYQWTTTRGWPTSLPGTQITAPASWT